MLKCETGSIYTTRKNKLAAEALLADEIEKYNLNNDDSHLSLALHRNSAENSQLNSQPT